VKNSENTLRKFGYKKLEIGEASPELLFSQVFIFVVGVY
jgi:hypothetical protein